MGNQFAPAGTVVYVARDTAPEGWLVADGREVSRTQYADLFAAIKVKFGMGDGIDTFKLPDLRGEFIRGLDGGRGVDSGRQFGSLQTDALKNHTHPYYFMTPEIPSHGDYGISTGPSQTHRYIHNEVTSPTGDAETRPRNIALLACIKY